MRKLVVMLLLWNPSLSLRAKLSSKLKYNIYCIMINFLTFVIDLHVFYYSTILATLIYQETRFWMSRFLLMMAGFLWIQCSSILDYNSWQKDPKSSWGLWRNQPLGCWRYLKVLVRFEDPKRNLFQKKRQSMLLKLWIAQSTARVSPKKALTLTNSWISSNPIPKLWILRFCFLIQFPNVMILTGISIADDSLRQYRGKKRFQRIRDCYIFYKGRSWDFHVSRFRQIQWFHHSSSVVVSPIVTFCLNRVEDKKSKEQMLVSSILVWVLKINVMLFFKSQIGKGENWKGGSPSAPESQNGI